MNHLIEHTTQPGSGQYIAVWIYDGKPWAESRRVVNGSTQSYNWISDEWEDTDGSSVDAVGTLYYTTQ